MGVPSIDSGPICHEGVTWRPTVEDGGWYNRNVLVARISDFPLEIAKGHTSVDDGLQDCWFVKRPDISGGSYSTHPSLEAALSEGARRMRELLENEVTTRLQQAEKYQRLLDELEGAREP